MEENNKTISEGDFEKELENFCDEYVNSEEWNSARISLKLLLAKKLEEQREDIQSKLSEAISRSIRNIPVN